MRATAAASRRAACASATSTCSRSTPRQLRALRGRTVAYIAQSAAASFDPSRTILDQVVEPAACTARCRAPKRRLKAIALFRELALPDPETIGTRYPHQVSGGQLQRLMAAMALITDPDVVILDEPTTALDVTTQIEVLRAFRRVVRERQVTAVYVSHDLAVVAQMADHILVLRDGRMRELNATEHILAAPAERLHEEPARRGAAGAARRAARRRGDTDVLLDVRGLSAGYGPRDAQGPAGQADPRGHRSRAQARPGDRRDRRIGFGQDDAGARRRRAAGALRTAHRVRRPRAASRRSRSATRDELRRIQIVFQSADTALNPSQTIERILARPLQFYKGLRGDAAASAHRRAARPGEAAARPSPSGCPADFRAGRSSASTWRARSPPSPT